ncbi:MAG: kynureninase, partial [Pseudomonadota bacterium]
MSDRARFEALDATDPLAALRDAFTLPPGVRYFDGNSLGPQPKAARAAVLCVLEQGWGEALIRGWNDEGWFELPDRTAEALAPLLGAAPSSVAVADSTSLNIFKLLAAALAARPGRTK